MNRLVFIAGWLWVSAALAADITQLCNRWTLRNDELEATVVFEYETLRLERLSAGKENCVTGKSPLSSHTGISNVWTLAGSTTGDIKLFDRTWGKRLEITLTQPECATRQV